MDIEFGKGIVAQINPAEQSDEWLLHSAQEIAQVAEARGLILPAAAGALAVESAVKLDKQSQEATPDTRESITSQLPSACQGYLSMNRALNEGRRNKDKISLQAETTLQDEFDAWFTGVSSLTLQLLKKPILHYSLHLWQLRMS